jgi:uncharacterized protein YbaP (TraB family)
VRFNPILGGFLLLLILTPILIRPAAAQEGAFLGVQYQDVTADEAAALAWPAPRGIKLTKVVPDTPAERAGLKEGDIILSVDGVDMTGFVESTVTSTEGGKTTHTTTRTAALVVFMRGKRGGDTVEILLVRDRREMRLNAALIAASAAPPPAPPPPPPACKGADVLAELKGKDPSGYARIIAEAAATPNSGALLWRIDRPGGASSYLFGTAHVTDDRVHALSPAVKAAFADAKRLALEVADLSGEAMSRGLQDVGDIFRLPPGRTLKSDLPPADYEALAAILKLRQVPEGSMDALKPWWVELTMLSLPQCEHTRQLVGLKPLDLRLADEAKSRGIPVVGLETIEDQLRAMDRVPRETQLARLKSSILYYDRNEDLFETLVQRYVARDISVIWALDVYLSERLGIPRTVLAPYEQELIIRRNHRMRDAALPLLEEGGLFIGVGAMHLIGKEGLVELLRRAGYTLTAVE